MATVTNNLTRIHDAEGALTTANIPTGGGGAAANTDIFLQGSQSLGKRQTTTAAAAGFVLVDAADNDVSAADVHVGVWFWVTHYGILDDLQILFATGTGSSTTYDAHAFPFATEYPKLGGWVRGWVDVSRTPEATGAGGGLTETALREYGVLLSFTGAPGGNAPNLIIDAADFTNGGAALTLTGTTGVWQDFATADENTTNQYGVFRTIGGVFNAYAPVQLGTSGSSLVFADSNFAIIFPQQALVHDTFMSVAIDLQNASTDITWTNGSLKSAGTKLGSVIVTGTSGVFAATNTGFNAMRIITLTSACTMTGCAFIASGLVTQAGAVLDGCSFVDATGAVALEAGALADITDCAFVSDGTGHAIRATAAGTYAFAGNTFDGYAGSNGSTGNEAFYNDSGGLITLNISGGDTPSVRDGSGASTVINSTVTVTVTPLATGSEVRAYRVSDGVELSGTESSTGSSFALSLPSGTAVDIVVLGPVSGSTQYVPIRLGNRSFTVSQDLDPGQRVDRNFSNP